MCSHLVHRPQFVTGFTFSTQATISQCVCIGHTGHNLLLHSHSVHISTFISKGYFLEQWSLNGMPIATLTYTSWACNKKTINSKSIIQYSMQVYLQHFGWNRILETCPHMHMRFKNEAHAGAYRNSCSWLHACVACNLYVLHVNLWDYWYSVGNIVVLSWLI